MARQYIKQQILDILHSANRDIDSTISKFVKGCLNRDDKMIVEAKEHAFAIMNPLQQSLSCVIDFIEETEEKSA